MTRTYRNEHYFFGFFAGLFILFLAAAVYTGVYYLSAIPFACLFFYAGWQSVRLLFFLLLFSLPFSAEYQFSPSLGTDFPDELLMLLVTAFFLLFWLFHPEVLSRQTMLHPIIVLLLLGLLWAVVSAVFSTDPLISAKYLLAKGWYTGAFVLAPLIVFREKNDLVKAAKVLSIAMIAVTVIILVRHAAYGFSFGGINKALQPFFRNHVNYSAMLVCILPPVWLYWRNTGNKKSKRVAAAVLLVLLAALYFSYARGAWLALLTGIAAAWLIRKKLVFAAYIAFIIVVTGAACWLKSNDRYLQYAHNYKTTIWHEDFREHIRATYELKDMSTAERFYRWIAGVRMIKDNWLTGYGPNTFYYNYKPYAIPAFKTWVSDNKERSTVHNYFLLVATEQGLPGLAFLLLLLGAMLWYAQRIYHRSAGLFYKHTAMTTGVILVMIMTVNFLSDLVETDKVGSLFYLCLAVLVIIDIRSRSRSYLSPHTQRIA